MMKVLRDIYSEAELTKAVPVDKEQYVGEVLAYLFELLAKKVRTLVKKRNIFD